MDKITDKIYLGDCDGAKDETKLKANNIKRVLSCCGYLSPKYEDKTIKQKIFELSDTPSTNIIQYFIESLKFIDESDDKVFVHCFAGVSRSATLVIAYFMWKDKLTYKQSYQFVKKYRFIGPKIGFIRQLLIFEKKLKDSDYDLDKINLNDVVWPPVEGVNLSYSDIISEIF